ncbi:MAG: FAD-dependent 5-carboxymethylaminomethyl-2-thiouridine(34) oxidoreductase MnmC [Xanthomonadaceae bacterium]|nr:FAD-dependent 5-carboxymethylaminomethyl-2-thiouridine(34) oxidoreductase MnmC [Xanthomonadaceae bacterium]
MKIKRPLASWDGNSLRQSEYNDIYFSTYGAIAESEHVYINGNDLASRLKESKEFWIGEIGFGAGINFTTTLRSHEQFPNTHLHYLSVENAPLERSFLIHTYAKHLSDLLQYSEWTKLYPEFPTAGFYNLKISYNITLHLLLGDAEQALKQWIAPHDFEGMDAWYLDGFTPSKNESAWSQKLLKTVAELSKIRTSIATYSVASGVRESLQQSGFEVEKAPGIGMKKHCLKGVLTHLQSRASPIDPWYSIPKNKEKTQSITVFGSGLAGASVARELAENGFNIRVLEPESEIAFGASGNSAGIFMPHLSNETNDTSRFSLHSFQVFQRWFDRYGSGLGERSGLTEWKEESQAIEEHSLVKGLAKIVDKSKTHYATSGWINPKEWCKSLLKHPRIIVETNAKLSLDSFVIIALGSRSLEFAPDLNVTLKAMKGQILRLPRDALTTSTDQVIMNDAYLIPTSNEYTLGATFEQKSDLSTDWESLSQFTDEALEKLNLTWSNPDTSIQKFNARASVRAMAPDKLPLVGMIPNPDYYQQHYSDLYKGRRASVYPQAEYVPNLMILSGLGSRGITYACSSAELIREILMNQAIGMDADLFTRVHPGRYIVRGFRSRKLKS